METLIFSAAHIFVIYCECAGYNFLSCLFPSLHPLLLKTGIEFSCGILPDSLKLPKNSCFAVKQKKSSAADANPDREPL